ncbi:Nematode resistance protein-like HSPRO2 [Dichanthelium oligosanthes]|uniref:Nematode resistance protein-like HSPRO2 n=1 Tax=Dichanthelium oligosanthes TaxID=888268 RepID=A0A1E5W872_9POAL|nr:Nematode resistance protein-like HSPRO2 [Dichanthelium oligosanthes]
MATPKLSPVSPVRRDDKPCAPSSSSTSSSSAVLRVQDASAAEAYEQYLRLPELSGLWKPGCFPEWAGEGLVKPALQALEVTFRLASLALSDPRGYASRRELARRVESLAVREAELVAALCEGDRSAPLAEITASGGVLPRERSGSEVWQLPGSAAAVVCWASEASLLPRLAAWDRSEALAARIAYAIEGQMQGCAFTLGLGEPNLAGKPVLEYDRVVRPHELHALKPKPAPEPKSGYRNRENETLFTMYQILESWLRAASQLLTRLNERIEAKNWEAAASDCWILERVWKLLADVEDLHMLMDPDDFLRLKSQLAIRAAPGSDASFCFRSRALLHVANTTRDLKKRVPWVLGVEVDPNGGPRVQEAAMRLYHSPRRGDGEEAGKVELLQAFQAVEAAVRRFFFAYRQLVAAMMGTAEASGNRALFVPAEGMDPLAQMFLEPPYYPSLDAAKTFLADYWAQKMVGASAPSRQN